MDSSRTSTRDVQGSRLLYQLCCDVRFSTESWQRRLRLIDRQSTCLNTLYDCSQDSQLFQKIIGGSCSEGMAVESLGSDKDIVFLVTGTSITQRNSSAIQQGIYRDHLFETIPSRHPAFVRLQLLSVGNRPEDNIVMTPDGCLSDIDGRFVLSSYHMRQLLLTPQSELLSASTEHGPAQTCTSSCGRFSGNVIPDGEVDKVLGLHCDFWPRVSSNWVSRHRQYNWPTADMIQGIMDQGCEVVPVGDLMSPFMDTEWRLSSSTAEKTLIRSFNIIQIQCYFLLKLTLVYLIKPQLPGTLCSYHIKNLMLYAVEETDPREWTEDNLSGCFEKCLRKLQAYLQDGYLPHYFIPEQNLFDQRVQGEARHRLVAIVGDLLTKGWRCVLQCPLFCSMVCDHNIPRCHCFIQYMKVLSNIELRKWILFIHLDSWQIVHRNLSVCSSASLLETVSVLLSETNRIPQEATVFFPCSQTAQWMKRCLKGSIGYSLLAVTRSKHGNTTRTVQPILAVAQQFLEDLAGVDVASGRLKLATFFYKTGQARRCVQIAVDVLRDYTDDVVSVCFDTERAMPLALQNPFLTRKLEGLLPMADDTEALLHFLAFPVTFSPWEIVSAPPGVQDLVFSRHLSTWVERCFCRNIIVIDPLVYAHYLLVISQLELGNYGDGRHSLETLARIVHHPRENALYYPEVARQLLDHCVLQTSRYDK